MVPGKSIDHEPGRSYDRKAREFANSGDVRAAATDAARAVEGNERETLRVAELIGKSRTANNEPRPDQSDSAWNKVAKALRRDWEQTKNRVMPNRAQHLGQTAGDTVRQALGIDDIPSGDKPVPPETDVSWDEAAPAIRFGHDAAGRFPLEQRWDPSFEDRLQNEWRAAQLGLPWSNVSHLVRFGWDFRRTRSYHA